LTVRVGVDSHVIAASPEWLDHLVGVLLDNACKYTPKQGAIEVRVAAEGNRIKLVVDDSGPGIPPEQRGAIFDRFQRATDQPGGAGLGLAIADAIVRATNGRWEVGASPAGGASMAVTWPRLLAFGATAGALVAVVGVSYVAAASYAGTSSANGSATAADTTTTSSTTTTTDSSSSSTSSSNSLQPSTQAPTTGSSGSGSVTS